MTMTAGFTLNLDDDRERRAAERESGAQPVPIILGGKTVAHLPPELPLQVLSPLRTLDEEITLLIRSAIVMWQGGESDTQRDAQTLIVNLLAANPNLPTALLDVIEEMGKRLLTDEGYAALVAEPLTRNDLGFIVGGILRFYGLTPGESSASSGSSTEGAGEQSSTTSPTTTTASMPEASGETPAIEASSESDDSSA